MQHVQFSAVTEFSFNLKKNVWLREERGFGFEEIVHLINQGEAVEVYPHSSVGYPHQFICEIMIEDYIYIVPFVVSGNKVFLKTIFPSRKATKKRKERRRT